MSTVAAEDGRSAQAVLIVLLSAVFMTTADNSIINVAVPSIRSDLRTSGAEVQLVVSGYLIAYAVLLVTSARMGDLFGYRAIFMIGLAVFTVASLVCGLAPAPTVLIGARVIQGIGAALMVPQVLSGIQRTFPPQGRARAIGLYSAALAGGAAVGQLLGGILVSADLFGTSWRPIFLINVPLGIALLIIAGRVLPPATRRGPSLDLGGVALLSIAILLLVVPVILGREAGWPPWALFLLFAFVPGLVVLIAFERRFAATGGQPLLNLRLVARPVVAWGLLALGAATVTYSALLFVVALFLQEALGKSPLYSGAALISWVLGFGVASQSVRRLLPLLGRRTAILGFGILGVAYACIALLATTGRPPHEFLLISFLGLGGLGMGIGFTALIGDLTDAAAEDDAADLSGLLTTNSELAAAVGVATLGSLYLGLATTDDTHAFTITATALAVVAGFAAIAAHRSSSRNVPELREASTSGADGL